MRELSSAVTRRLAEQAGRKSALELWAKLSAAFDKAGADGVEKILEKLAKRANADDES
jgi:hypothetical protein